MTHRTLSPRPSVVVAALLAAVALAGAAEPKYPKVSTATGYRVDPAWPQRPDNLVWGAVPGVAVDAQDRIWVYTRGRSPVQCYDGATGKFLFAWGEDHIKTSHHIKIGPKGNVWVADIGNHVVMQFTPEGRLLRTLGTKGVSGRDQAHLNQPTDMAVTPAGDVFVSDGYGNNRVVHFDKDGRFVKEWGELGSAPGQFSIPHGIAVDSQGRLYVADRNNARVQVFDADGKLLDVWNNLLVPWGLCVTGQDEVWVCGSSPMQWREGDTSLGCPPKDQVFMKFNPQGKLLQLFTVPKGADGLERPGEVNWVHAIAVDSKGNLYAGDIIGKRAQKFARLAPTTVRRVSAK